MRIVIIEDDEDVRELLVQGLKAKRHDVITGSHGAVGLGLVMTQSPDFIVLDLGLPDLDGLDVLKMIRSAVETPVIIMTGRSADSQVIRALELGADDYVTKPVTAAVLDARMSAIARRSRARSEPEQLQVGELVIDPLAHCATLGTRTLSLRPKEFQLLAYLASQAGRVVTKSELRSEVWDGDYSCVDKTLDVHLCWLRRHLGETAAAPRYIHTIRGVGVKLMAPAS